MRNRVRLRRGEATPFARRLTFRRSAATSPTSWLPTGSPATSSTSTSSESQLAAGQAPSALLRLAYAIRWRLSWRTHSDWSPSIHRPPQHQPSPFRRPLPPRRSWEAADSVPGVARPGFRVSVVPGIQISWISSRSSGPARKDSLVLVAQGTWTTVIRSQNSGDVRWGSLESAARATSTRLIRSRSSGRARRASSLRTAPAIRVSSRRLFRLCRTSPRMNERPKGAEIWAGVLRLGLR